MRILIDLDDTLADFQGRLAEIYNENYPEKALDFSMRKEFYLGLGDTKYMIDDAWHIMRGIGFFLSLNPVDGAIEAVKNLKKEHEVYIVTSAGSTFPLAPSEKYQWVERNFGHEMLSNLVITPAKHAISGDILIDDKPEVDEDKSDWTHVLFDQPYNRNIDKPRLDWSNYKNVVDNLKI